MGPTGPMWAPCWPHEPCYQGVFIPLIIIFKWKCCLWPLHITKFIFTFFMCMYVYLCTYMHSRMHKYMHICNILRHIVWFMNFYRQYICFFKLSRLLFAFMKIFTDAVIVIVITDMYRVFTNHKYFAALNMMRCSGFTMESDNNCISYSYLLIVPDYK